MEVDPGKSKVVNDDRLGAVFARFEIGDRRLRHQESAGVYFRHCIGLAIQVRTFFQNQSQLKISRRDIADEGAEHRSRIHERWPLSGPGKQQKEVRRTGETGYPCL